MLRIENLRYVEVNMHVHCDPALKLHGAETRERMAEWLRQRHHSSYYKTSVPLKSLGQDTVMKCTFVLSNRHN